MNKCRTCKLVLFGYKSGHIAESFYGTHWYHWMETYVWNDKVWCDNLACRDLSKISIYHVSYLLFRLGVKCPKMK